MADKVYYRPEWTCGRYNKEFKVAIYYNLIEGMSYFFENDSAEIVGRVLSIPLTRAFQLMCCQKKPIQPRKVYYHLLKN